MSLHVSDKWNGQFMVVWIYQKICESLKMMNFLAGKETYGHMLLPVYFAVIISMLEIHVKLDIHHMVPLRLQSI